MAEERERCWQEIGKSECFRLLAGQQLGRIAIVDDLGPVIFPVNYMLDRYMIVIRTSEGTKLEAAAAGRKVAFEVDGTDEVTSTGWSVVVRGEATEVAGDSELERMRSLPLIPWAPGDRTRYLRILPAAVTGRRILASGSRQQAGCAGAQPMSSEETPQWERA
jgi:uncharacterized protein